MKLVKNGYVITMDPERRVFTDGGVLIDGDRIVAVGKSADLARQHPEAEVVDARDKVVLPGLVDAHTHAFQVLYRGLGDDWPLVDWLARCIWPLSAALGREESRVGALLCSLEMLKTGTTAFVDSHYVTRDKECYDGIAEAVEQIGIRGVVVRGTVNSSPAPEPFHEAIDVAQREAARVIERYHGAAGGRITVRVEPLNESLTTRDMVRAMYEVARSHKVGMSMHLAEVSSRVEAIRAQWGRSSVGYLHDLGVLGPHLLLAHCVWVDDEDIALLAVTDTRVVHNPVSNQYLADGVMPLPAMRKKGVLIALGADGAASNNSQDMFEVMKSAVLMQKVHTLDPLALTAEKALEMATIDGARAIGMADEIGSLEAGKKADIVLVDTRRPEMVPAISRVSNLVYAARGGAVDTVLVDGQVVVAGGQLRTMDESGIMDLADRTTRSMIERTGSTALLQRGSWKVI